MWIIILIEKLMMHEREARVIVSPNNLGEKKKGLKSFVMAIQQPNGAFRIKIQDSSRSSDCYKKIFDESDILK